MSGNFTSLPSCCCSLCLPSLLSEEKDGLSEIVVKHIYFKSHKKTVFLLSPQIYEKFGFSFEEAIFNVREALSAAMNHGHVNRNNIYDCEGFDYEKEITLGACLI